MSKYFGTDGIRGKYGDNLDSALAYKVGRAVATYFGEGKIIVGRDTRVSGEEIEDALERGLSDGGAEVLRVNVLPTPAVARLAVQKKAACGIMVSASHNPPEYNGIKIFDGNGLKLTEEQEGSIEYYIDNPPQKAPTKGRVSTLEGARERYIDGVIKAASADLRGLEVILDCGYGAAGTVAEEIFTRCGAKVLAENKSLRGEKINCGCGALHPDYVGRSLLMSGGRLGFAFDGDADRLSVVHDGVVVDGDSVLYVISRSLELRGGVVVGTVLSNLALERQLAAEGKRLIRTPVGDKYICDLLHKKGYSLGGEQSGHYIIYPAATTGDGILSALTYSKAVYRDGILDKPFSLGLTPQKSVSVYAREDIMFDPEMLALIEKYTEYLSPSGRLIVRYSGTEPKVRVMAESDDENAVKRTLDEFVRFIGGKAR